MVEKVCSQFTILGSQNLPIPVFLPFAFRQFASSLIAIPARLIDGLHDKQDGHSVQSSTEILRHDPESAKQIIWDGSILTRKNREL